jgi:hypothetical protein
LQNLAGEFRYNVVYGFGHTWVRSAGSNASIHHNLFAPGGDGGLNAGIQCYGGESGLQIYNNTFDGGGAAVGDFAGPTVDMSGGSKVSSFRNNLVTFSRNQNNDSPGAPRVVGGSSAYAYADYNAFYSPDNANKTNYDWSGAGAHDASDGSQGQLASDPFAGARIATDGSRMIESTIDEAAIWQGTQTVSQVLAIFRSRYTPKAGSAVIDSGDPQDDDAQGRRTDIGAIDLSGHDQDKLGMFGDSSSVHVAPPPTMNATMASGSAGSGGTGGNAAITGGGGSAGQNASHGATGGKGAETGGVAASSDRTSSAGPHSSTGSCNCSVMGSGSRHPSALSLTLAMISAATAFLLRRSRP